MIRPDFDLIRARNPFTGPFYMVRMVTPKPRLGFGVRGVGCRVWVPGVGGQVE